MARTFTVNDFVLYICFLLHQYVWAEVWHTQSSTEYSYENLFPFVSLFRLFKSVFKPDYDLQ